MSEHRIPKESMQWRPVDRRRIGRSKDTWHHAFQPEMAEKNLDREEVEARAGDQGAWRKFFADLWTTNGL